MADIRSSGNAKRQQCQTEKARDSRLVFAAPRGTRKVPGQAPFFSATDFIQAARIGRAAENPKSLQNRWVGAGEIQMMSPGNGKEQAAGQCWHRSFKQVGKARHATTRKAGPLKLSGFPGVED